MVRRTLTPIYINIWNKIKTHTRAARFFLWKQKNSRSSPVSLKFTHWHSFADWSNEWSRHCCVLLLFSLKLAAMARWVPPSNEPKTAKQFPANGLIVWVSLIRTCWECNQSLIFFCYDFHWCFSMRVFVLFAYKVIKTKSLIIILFWLLLLVLLPHHTFTHTHTLRQTDDRSHKQYILLGIVSHTSNYLLHSSSLCVFGILVILLLLFFIFSSTTSAHTMRIWIVAPVW